VLGNIITALQSNKSEWAEEKGTLQSHIHQISAQFIDVNTENEALRNITAQLRNELRSIKIDDGSDEAQPPHLENIESNPTPQPKSNSASNRTTPRSSRSLSSISIPKTKKISANSNSNRVSFRIDPAQCPQTRSRRSSERGVRRVRGVDVDDEVQCLRQKMHSLEMEKLSLVKWNAQNVRELQEMVARQQTLQSKLTHSENENMRLRAQTVAIDAQSSSPSPSSLITREERSLRKVERKLNDVASLSFEEVVDEIKRLEHENKASEDLKAQLFALRNENQKLKERLAAKENENAALFEKYNVTLTQYHILCKHYLK